jgi:hypothetical protein
VTAQATGAIRPESSEHAAALHILAAPCIWDRAARFVNDSGEVDWLGLGLAAGVWSWGEWLLVAAAQDLFNGCEPAGLKRLAGTLDPANLRRVLEAICLLRPDVAPPKGWSR